MILVYLCLAWLAGSAFAASRYDDAWQAIFLAGAAVCLALVVSRRWKEAAVLGLAVFCALVSFSRYEHSGPGYPKFESQQGITVRGEVIGEPDWNGETQSFLVRIEELDGADGDTAALEGERVRVVTRPYPRFARGDIVALTGDLQSLDVVESDGYRAYLERVGVAGTMRYPEVAVLDHRSPDALVTTMASLRHRLGDALERSMPEPEAALAKGMLLGQRDGIPRDVEARFNDAGISHLIVISGANIMLVAGFVVGALRGAAGRRYATVAAMLVVVAYAAFVGGSPPVWRAAAMAIVVLGGVLAGRGDIARGVASPLRSYGLNALLLAAVAMTVLDPQVVDEVSFQLSFAATAGIVLFAGRLEEKFDAALRALPEAVARFLAGHLAMTTAASIAVIPIIAAYFARLSLVSLPANLLAAPLFALALGGSVLTALAGSLDPRFGVAVGAAGRLPMSLLVALAEVASSLPLASVEVRGYGATEAIATYLVLAVGLTRLLARRSRNPEEASVRRWRIRWSGAAALATAVVAATVWWSAFAPEDDRLRVTVLDVGQGDAILIETPQGHRVLIDGGPSGAVLMQALGEALPASERDIDLVVLTHAQDDHVSGFVELLARFDVHRALEGPLPGDTGAYRAWRDALAREGAVALRPEPGQRIELGDAHIEVLAPEALLRTGDLNENSIVLRLVYGDISFLLTGDLGEEGEAALLDTGFDLRSTVLKVGHHGSNAATSRPFLDAVAPAVAVVSAGEGNPFGHPSPGMRLRLGDIPLFRTDQNGNVTFETDGAGLWVTPQRGGLTAGPSLATQ